MRWIKKNKEEDKLRKELKRYREAGIRLLLDGHPSSPREIARACTVSEDGTYMRDYISGDTDEIREIAFVRIRDIE